MQVQIPIFILSLLVHTSIFLTSEHRDRRARLVAGLFLLCSTWLLWYGGLLLEGSGERAARWLGLVLVKAPYYLPFMSFFVYLRRQGGLSSR